MTHLSLHIDMDNAAFEEINELPNLLNTTMHKIIDGDQDGVIVDSNGNRVGQWAITPDD